MRSWIFIIHYSSVQCYMILQKSFGFINNMLIYYQYYKPILLLITFGTYDTFE